MQLVGGGLSIPSVRPVPQRDGMGVWWAQGKDGHGGLVETTATRTAGYELGLGFS